MMFTGKIKCHSKSMEWHSIDFGMKVLFQRNDLRCLSRTLIYDFCVDLGVLDALMGQHSADSENVNTIGCKERGEAVAHRVESDASG